VHPCEIPSPTIPNSTRKIRELKLGARRRPSLKCVTPHKQPMKQRPNHKGNTQISSKASQFLPTHGQKHGQDPKRRALSQHSSRTPVPNRTAEFIASMVWQAGKPEAPGSEAGPVPRPRRAQTGRRIPAVGAREEAGDDGRTDGRSERRRRRTDATAGREGRTRRELKGADFLADHPERKKIGERKRKGS